MLNVRAWPGCSIVRRGKQGLVSLRGGLRGSRRESHQLLSTDCDSMNFQTEMALWWLSLWLWNSRHLHPALLWHYCVSKLAPENLPLKTLVPFKVEFSSADAEHWALTVTSSHNCLNCCYYHITTVLTFTPVSVTHYGWQNWQASLTSHKLGCRW